MFTSISLENFKCFLEKKDFQLRNINVFTGYNGRGKSTVFQAFLLLAQSLYDNKSLKELIVNSMFCKLGLFEDLINHNSTSKEINFHFTTDNASFSSIRIAYKEFNDRKGELSDITINDKSYFERSGEIGGTLLSNDALLQVYPDSIHSIFNNFNYISANRIGPTSFEVKQDLYENNPIGQSGEFRLNVLAGRTEIQKQISEIIARIMDGGYMSVTGDSHTEKYSEVLKLYFTSIDSNKPIKSINCGFGYSYIIPIILAAINMKGGCLFIENPEAHLHPYAQSQLIKELVMLCSQNKIQLFIESHSEHVINALRICTLLDDYPDFTHSNLSIYFFDRDMSIKSLNMESNGQISSWPLGFFDQAERDAAKIIQLGLFK